MANQNAPGPLTGGQLVLGTIALSLATFMNVLDTSIANVSIPAISGDLGVSSSQGTWVITSFAVANAISVPLTGWLTERFGAVRLFITSILLFVLASWLCGMAPTLEFLLAARVLQGAVAGPMIPLSQSLLLSSYPPAKSSMALARHLDIDERGAPFQPHHFQRGARQRRQLGARPGLHQPDCSIHVAVLDPLGVEHRRLVGNADVLDQLRHDFVVPQATDKTGKAGGIHGQAPGAIRPPL